MPEVPLSRTDLSHCFRGRYAERGVAVQDGDADLELGDLTVEVPSHEPLAQQFHAMHLRLDAASAVISAPSSPDRAAEVFRCPQCFVSSDRTGGDRLPRFGVLAGWDELRGHSGDRAIAPSWHFRVSVSANPRRDAPDLLVRRDLGRSRSGSNRYVTDMLPGDLDSANIQCGVPSIIPRIWILRQTPAVWGQPCLTGVPSRLHPRHIDPGANRD